MRFIIKHKSSGSERVGALLGFRKSPGTMIETPTAALLTQGGSVVHLTADVLNKTFKDPQLLWVPLSNTIQLEPGIKAQNEGIAKFAGLPHHITYMTLHNISEETHGGHFENDKVPLWSKRGKQLINASRYMDIMEVFKPDIILAVADGQATLQDGNKRITKAINRTSNMLKVCVERMKTSEELQQSSLVGVLIGTHDFKKCEESLENIRKYADSLFGVSLVGITNGSEESLNIKPDDIKDILEKVGKALPENLVRIMEGAWNPAIVLTAVEHGWDIFDGSFPVKLTNAGLALQLSFDVTKEVKTAYIMDMNDECYKEDFSPILEDCECLACKKHTRAYIRHLLNTREMLASVLLSIHNLHHFDQIFCHARQHIAAKTFATYKEHITKQCEHYNNIPYRYKGSNDNSDKKNAQKLKKIKTNEGNTEENST